MSTYYIAKKWMKLHKNGKLVWINFSQVNKFEPKGKKTHIDFVDPGLWETVDESAEQISQWLDHEGHSFSQRVYDPDAPKPTVKRSEPSIK